MTRVEQARAVLAAGGFFRIRMIWGARVAKPSTRLIDSEGRVVEGIRESVRKALEAELVERAPFNIMPDGRTPRRLGGKLYAAMSADREFVAR